MERHVRPWRIAGAAASTTLLLALPALAAAAHLTSEPLGTTIFNRVIQRLCEIQQALGNRVILADPARCAPPPPPPPPPVTLTLVKMVVNDNGGTATSSDFTIHLHQAPSMVDVPGSPQTGSATGTTYTNLSAGNYHVAETGGPSGYVSSFSGGCDANGNVTLAAGENKTCAITNDDAAGRLIVDKVTVPSGSAAVFTIAATGTGAISGGGAGTITDATTTEFVVSAGTYAVSESVLAGWIQVSNTCVNIVVGVGETKTCTIVNHRLPRLTVTKIVVNNNGGTATTTDFTLMIDGATTTSGVSNIVATGTRIVSEGAHAGYTSTIGGHCAPDGSVTLAIGDSKSCTVTNDDNEPPEMIGHVVISEVYYDVASTTAGSESSNEWVELYNGSNADVNLQGWFVGDASSTDSIVDSVMVQPGGRVVIVGSTTPTGIPAGVPVVVLNSSIGNNGFTNNGDGARLLNPASTLVDSVGYGDNATVSPNVSIPGSHDGHSIMRIQLTSDTDTAADWADTSIPTPGS